MKKKIRNARNFVRLKRNSLGHVSRMEDDRVINWYLRCKRKRGRQRKKWADELVNFITNKNYERRTRYRDEWVRLSVVYAQNMDLNK